MYKIQDPISISCIQAFPAPLSAISISQSFKMVFFTSFVLSLAVASLASSRPNPRSPPDFQVTSLNTFEPSGRPESNSPYRVGFNVADPSGEGSTAFCEARWAYADATTGYPSSYLANCSDPNYAFKFVDYNNYYDFKLDVKHSTQKHGKTVTKFAQGLVDFTIIQCSHAASGFSVCNQRDGVAFPLPVYDVQKA
ncbi:hypothetical protein K469DRAFT_747529 [Zopfia rhizophila CBS 207.26]|uniref:AA1-like domain-containing protein n=1 Tax=Zopfia rhizophila CBS 207.26 TaxID=1314779 RepID=A0A6A6EFW1_9PEZI|nr:hypothetical protein K469DRAFT_747529 [Zopfia rhizophila CBS 207.26]